MGRSDRRRAPSALGILLIGVLLAGACSSGDEAADDGRGATSVIEREREKGPAAVLARLAGGNGSFFPSTATGPSLDEVGYAETEYMASGTATSYTSAGPLPADGTFELRPGETAEYRTRVIVRRPARAEAFNGTVVVEWLNVSGGLDASPDYTYLGDELLRGGYAYVGVSAQRIGVEGGEVAVAVPIAESVGAGRGLKAIDPERYGELSHPGDAFAYDIYTQVGRAMRAGGDGGGVDPMDGLDVERVLAVGESQSAYALTTYIDGVQPIAGAYDGFLVHSRGGAAFPLGEPGAGVAIADAIGGEPTRIRTDGDAPVIVVQTETDVLGLLGFLPARQDDDDRFRLWEVAGTAHADKVQLGDLEAGLGCAQPINRGQQVFVLRAALRSLDAWVGHGEAPPEAPRLDVDESGSAPAFRLDAAGNVTGGIRTPAVDVPVDVLSGMPVEGSSVVCLLMGTTTPIDRAELVGRYGTTEAYLEAYEAATDEMIAAGFALEDDRDQLLDGAAPGRLGPG